MHGLVVRVELMEEVQKIFLEKYGIQVVREHNARMLGERALHEWQETIQWFTSYYGMTWEEVFSSVSAEARLNFLRQRECKLEKILEMIDRHEKTGNDLRRTIVRKCMALASQRGGLVWKCALLLAQNLVEEEVRIPPYIPHHVTVCQTLGEAP